MSHIWTYQECVLIGATPNIIQRIEPYKPLAIILGEMTPEACEEDRQFPEDFMGSICAPYFGKSDYTLEGQLVNTPITIEHLDLNPESPTYGCTIRDPRLVVYDKLRDAEPGEDWSDRFPLKRK